MRNAPSHMGEGLEVNTVIILSERRRIDTRLSQTDVRRSVQFTKKLNVSTCRNKKKGWQQYGGYDASQSLFCQWDQPEIRRML